MRKSIVTNNYEIVTNSKVMSGTDVNAYAFTNAGTTQVIIQGENVFPNQTLVFNSNNDESLDFSTYDISFVFPNNPNNRVLVRRRKVTWTN